MSIMSKRHSEVARGPFLFCKETWSMEGNDPVEVDAVYTANGDYVGDVESAEELEKRGIAPEKRTPQSSVCSIGFSARDQKWFGWSHRAIYGFKVGDVVKEGDCAADGLPVGFEAKTLDDAKEMAKAFAASVS